MMQVVRSRKVLIGVKAVTEYLSISEPTFYKFINLGLPAIVIDGRWYAHTDNIDDYFKKITSVRMPDVPKGRSEREWREHAAAV